MGGMDSESAEASDIPQSRYILNNGMRSGRHVLAAARAGLPGRFQGSGPVRTIGKERKL